MIRLVRTFRKVAIVSVRKDLAETLRCDKSGAAMMEIQRSLKTGRSDLMRHSDGANLELAAKAYDAGIALLPELWRLEQRK